MTTLPQDYYASLVRSVIADRKWISAFDVAVSASGVARRLMEMGATDCLVIGASRGTGTVSEDAIVLDATADTMMGGIRASEQVIDSLPASVVAQVDAFDPDRTAGVIRPMFSEGGPVAGRHTYGRRQPSWRSFRVQPSQQSPAARWVATCV